MLGMLQLLDFTSYKQHSINQL